MNRTETDLRSKVFWSILFTVTFLFAAEIVPKLGITFSFLSFGGRISVSRVTPDMLLSFGTMVSGAELFLVKSVITAFYHLAAWREVSLSTLVVGTLLPELLYNLITLFVMYFVTVFLARLFRVEIDA